MLSKLKTGAVTLSLGACLVSSAAAQQSGRTELKRADLTGTNMEVIVSVNEWAPGVVGALHIHHGEEVFYVLEGGTIEFPDGRQLQVPAGLTDINVRDVPHGALKVVGDKTMKLLTVHIIDKGKPMFDAPK